MKSFSVLINEQTGGIALCNSHRQDYAELLLSNYVPVKDGGKKELEEWLKDYFDHNNIPFENQLYLTIS